MWLSERNLAVGTAMYKDVIGRGGDEDTEKVSGASPGPGPGPGTAWVVESPYLHTCITTHSLGVFFFSIFRKRQPEFPPTSQCPSAHVQLWKPPPCSECVREAAWKNIVVCPLLSLSWVFPLSNMETDVVHAIENEEPLDVPWFARLPWFDCPSFLKGHCQVVSLFCFFFYVLMQDATLFFSDSGGSLLFATPTHKLESEFSPFTRLSASSWQTELFLLFSFILPFLLWLKCLQWYCLH